MSNSNYKLCIYRRETRSALKQKGVLCIRTFIHTFLLKHPVLLEIPMLLNIQRPGMITFTFIKFFRSLENNLPFSIKFYRDRNGAKTLGSKSLFHKDSHFSTARFIKPYRDPVTKCTWSRQGFMEWAIAHKNCLRQNFVIPFQLKIKQGVLLCGLRHLNN